MACLYFSDYFDEVIKLPLDYSELGQYMVQAVHAMKYFTKLMHQQQQKIVQNVLDRVDLIGSRLNDMGIQNNINRHTLIGQAWIQKHRLEGELARLELFLQNQLRPIRKIGHKIDDTIDGAIDHLPPVLAKRAHRTHDQLKQIHKC